MPGQGMEKYRKIVTITILAQDFLLDKARDTVIR